MVCCHNWFCLGCFRNGCGLGILSRRFHYFSLCSHCFRFYCCCLTACCKDSPSTSVIVLDSACKSNQQNYECRQVALVPLTGVASLCISITFVVQFFFFWMDFPPCLTTWCWPIRDTLTAWGSWEYPFNEIWYVCSPSSVLNWFGKLQLCSTHVYDMMHVMPFIFAPPETTISKYRFCIQL